MDDLEIFRKLSNCQDKEQMARVIEEYNERNKPKTNADRIRAMTDEELAEFLEEMTYDSMEHRAEYWFEWLQQPAEVDHG